MLTKIKKYAISLLTIIVLIAAASFVFADTTPAPANQAEKTQLQLQLNDIEKQIEQFQQQLKEIKGQKKTLQNKISQLKKQQATLNLQIQATNLQIAQINSQMAETLTSIDQNTAKINELKKQIAQFIHLIYQNDDYSLLDILLSQDNLSDILNQLENYSQMSEQLSGLVNKVTQANNQLSGYKLNLTQQQNDDNNLLSIQSLQQEQLVGSVGQQNGLLQQTKGVESNYQAVLSDTQKQAAQIRSRLYQLLGISGQITFGQALEIAQWAFGQTGVRASFLLAILTQESNLGKNVGTCNRPGDPPNKSYKAIMKPDRDIPPFLQITADLGMDPAVTPVSCPMHDRKGNQVGWGGAMGPSQFIPSTWIGYKDQVAALTGKAANPWDIRDAFLASAIKLKAGGGGNIEGEWAAAMRYFSGGTNVKYRFYGDNVVATATQYQSDIDNLNK